MFFPYFFKKQYIGCFLLFLSWESTKCVIEPPVNDKLTGGWSMSKEVGLTDNQAISILNEISLAIEMPWPIIDPEHSMLKTTSEETLTRSPSLWNRSTATLGKKGAWTVDMTYAENWHPGTFLYTFLCTWGAVKFAFRTNQKGWMTARRKPSRVSRAIGGERKATTTNSEMGRHLQFL